MTMAHHTTLASSTRIWKSREESELGKLREKHDKEKKELRRQLTQKFSYTQLTAKKEISRLRTIQRKKSPPSNIREKSYARLALYS